MNDDRSMALSCTLTKGFDNVMSVLMSESNFILCLGASLLLFYLLS